MNHNMKSAIAAIAITLALTSTAFAQNSSECTKTFDPKVTVCEVTVNGHTTYTELTDGSIKEITAQHYKLVLEITLKSLQEARAKEEAAHKAKWGAHDECLAKALKLPFETGEQTRAMLACRDLLPKD